MRRAQIIAILSVLALFCLLYFGCDTKPKEQRALEKSRMAEIEVTSPEILLAEAKQNLDQVTNSAFLTLEMELKEADDSLKVEILKDLSSKWYNTGKPILAGCYAQEVAEILNTEESWSIAGTSFILGVRTAETEKEKTFAARRSVKCLENAISLAPNNIDHKINLALSYTERPPSDNPMKGVLMLRDLSESNPENTGVLNQLARLAIKTNQFDKALERLKTSEGLNDQNETTICLLAQVYELRQEKQNADIYNDKCNLLISKSK